MAAPKNVVSELQKVAPSQIIELYELKLKTSLHGSNDTYRFHAGVNAKPTAGGIVWNGNTYQAYPVEAEGFEYNGEGQLPRPKIRVSNQLGLITALLIQVNGSTPGNDLVGATITRIRCLAKHLDAVNFPNNTNPYGTPDPTAEFPREVFYIARKTQENRDVVEFELAAAFDLAGVRAPRRLCIANICNWVYRSAECGYTGTAYFDTNDDPVNNVNDDVCSKRLAGCEARFGAVSITGSVTAGSTTLSGLTSNQLARINVGDPVNGHGIASGTTVAGKGSSTVTLSQAATSSTSLTRTGTLSADGLSIVLSSAASLRPGMQVSGSNVPGNTTIASISGNTVTLSITYNSNVRGSLATKTVTVGKGTTYEYWTVSDTSGIQVNDYAGNNSGVTTDQPQGTNVYAGTTVSAIVGNNIWLSKFSRFLEGETLTAAFWRPKTFSSATYTFGGSPIYTIRANNLLPYGSFPGVGGFYA
jgi:lambda family phage minor tail protein L